MRSTRNELPSTRWLWAGPPKLLISLRGASHHSGRKPGQHPKFSSFLHSPLLACYKAHPSSRIHPCLLPGLERQASLLFSHPLIPLPPPLKLENQGQDSGGRS